MTEKLYLQDSYQKTVQAAVLTCEEQKDGYIVELDRSVFYPTGGGQPHDIGTIGDATVTDVSERGERVLHAVSIPFKPGDAVVCEIDWARRYDYMQQHSGEHLLSFAAKELFGAVNVGFHLADSYCTIDLDMPLTREQIEAIENKANNLVFENLPVLVKYMNADDLGVLELRKKADVSGGKARIVYMPGGDSCTCCGTHVAHTGEIGVIAVTSAKPHKGGVRVSLVCGMRALRYLQKSRNVLSDIARAYSCKAEDVMAAAEQQRRELSQIKCENKALQTRLVRALSNDLLREATLVNGKRLIVRLVDVPASQLRALASALCDADDMLALLLARSEEGVQYALCRSDGIELDMGKLARYINQVLQAKGGGRRSFAQGSAVSISGLDGNIERLAEFLALRLLDEI